MDDPSAVRAEAPSGLAELLAEKREELARSWLEQTLSRFPGASVSFLKNAADPFANPFGTTLANELRGLLDVLLGHARVDETARHLDRVVQLLGVQDGPPSAAVSFVFALKGVVRGVLAAGPPRDGCLEELPAFDALIDRLALLAFDSYSKFQRQISELRIQEVKKRVSTLMRMSKLSAESLG